MERKTGHLAELRLFAGEEQALIACPPEMVPAPGQYLLAAERGAIQTTPLFLAGTWKQGFQAAKPQQVRWQPGTDLSLFGPLGNGFHLPGDVQRLAMLEMGNSNSCLLPIMKLLHYPGARVTLFSNAPMADLPPEMEAYPMQDFQDSLDWADYFIVDVPLEKVDSLIECFPQSVHQSVDIRGQVLVQSKMPCCGLGKCGVCSIKVKRAWKLVCEDGPVFNLSGVLQGLGM